MQIELLHTKFDHIHKVIASKQFLQIEAVEGGIPFWISAYHPKQEVEVEREIINLQRRLENEGIYTLLIDLFALSMQIADTAIGLDKLFIIEKKKGKERFKSALQSTINIHERLIPKIKERIEESKPKALLLTGVGKVFPFIRSHNVLNNLQSAVTDIPTLMFFPGKYTGQTLELFGTLIDDNYYRASNIDNYKR